MGLSKLFPCCRDPEPQAEEPPPRIKTKEPSDNAKAPAVTNVPSESPKNAETPKKESTETPEQESADVPKQESAEKPKQEEPANVQDTPQLNISQRVWNRAYDELAEDAATKSLVEDYMRAVQKANRLDEDPSTSEIQGDITELDSHVRREKALRKTVQSGAEKIYKSTKLTNAVGGVSEFVLKLKEPVDLAVGTNPQAALPWAGVCIGLQFLLNPSKESKANEAGISYVISRMEWYCSLTDHVLSEKNIVIGEESFEDVHRRLEARVTALYKALLLYQMKSACSYYRNQGWTFIRNIISLDDWNGQFDSVKEAERAVEKDSTQYNEAKTQGFLSEIVGNAIKSQEILGNFHETFKDYIVSQRQKTLGEYEDRCLTDLFVVNPQAQMTTVTDKDALIPEAYQWILGTAEYQSFTNWTEESPCKVLWLNGAAGTGKTMLMIGIITEVYQQSKLAPGISYFFCQAEDKTHNSAMDALRSLIWLLLIQQPHLISYLVETHKKSGAAMFHGRNAFASLRDTFKEMLADENLFPVYLAFDALDECAEPTEEAPGVQGLISLIVDTLKNTGRNSKKIKWLLSSRPETDVYNKLSVHAEQSAIVELDVMARPEAVNAYVTHKLSQLQTERRYSKDVLEEISVEIHRNEQTTFLWVSLVLKDLAEVPQRRAVKHVRETPKSLTAKYELMMQRVEEIDYIEDRECSIRVLEAVCFAVRPLSYGELHAVADLPSDVPADEMVQNCGSFLTVHDGTVHVLHHSTGQYLAKYFESHHEGGATHIHESMAKNSINIMSKRLSQNMYSIQPGTLAQDIMVPEEDPLSSIKYACEFWVDHLFGTEAPREDHLSDSGVVFGFLKEHFLHWLEALAIIRKLPKSLSLMRKLIRFLEQRQDSGQEILRFLKDAERFVITSHSTIETAPLQIYGSAICFSPLKSEIHTRYWKQRLPPIGNVTGTRDYWDHCLHTQFLCPKPRILTFSLDGKTFASSTNEVVQVWDAHTGYLIHRFELDDNVAFAIALSPDSKWLAGLCLGSMRLWDMSNGECTRKFDLHFQPTDHFDFILPSVAFSANGDTLAISVGEKVELRDISTGQCSTSLCDHKKEVTSFTFSPDGNTVASASVDKTVKIWDYLAGICRQTLEEAKDPYGVLFSPDGKRLVCVNRDQTLTFWDMPSGRYSHTLELEGGVKPYMQFPEEAPSILGAGFVSSSEIGVATNSGHIYVFDIISGRRVQKFSDGSDLLHITTCPATGRVVSASDIGMLRTWDAAKPSQEPDIGHEQAIMAVKSSPDGRTVATASMDKTIKLWSTTDRTCIHTLRGHTDEILALDFSPDGKILISGSLDCTARVWYMETGRCIKTLERMEYGACGLAFSEDGAILATGSNVGSLQLWETGTWTCKQNIENDKRGILGGITGAKFSPKCDIVIVGRRYGGGNIYDVSTGAHIRALSNESDQLQMGLLAISPDCKMCAITRELGKVDLWDIATGSHLQSLDRGMLDNILSFSPDGTRLNVSTGLYKLNPSMPSTPPDFELSPSALYFEGEAEWLSRGGKKLLLIPYEYRGRSTAVGENIFVQTNMGGQVVFLTFE